MIVYLSLVIAQANEVVTLQSGEKILIKDNFTWEPYGSSGATPPVIEKWKSQTAHMGAQGVDRYLKKDRYGDTDPERSEATFQAHYEAMVNDIYTGSALQTVLRNRPRLLSGMSFYDNQGWVPNRYQFDKFSSFSQQSPGVYVGENMTEVSYSWDEMGDGNPDFAPTEAVATLGIPGISQQQLNTQCGDEEGWYLGSLTVQYQTKVTLTVSGDKISQEEIQAKPIKVISCEGMEY